MKPAGEGRERKGDRMRIVAGQFRGRPLAAPEGARTRPTSDRVREAVFNILEHGIDGFSLAGLRVLDLFAGTGALGLEALSRGAAFCLFVEEDAAARGLIRRNIEALGLTGITKVFRRDASRPGRGRQPRRVRARLPRSALRAGPGAAGARLRRKGRLARGRGGGRDRGQPPRRPQPAGGICRPRSAHLGRRPGPVRAVRGAYRFVRMQLLRQRCRRPWQRWRLLVDL